MSRIPRRGRWAFPLIVTILAVSVLSCTATKRSATPPPNLEPTTEYWTRLSDPMKERLRNELTQEQVDTFQKLVHEACRKSDWIDCICCGDNRGVCNPTSWDCCASAVFVPGDGSSCSFPPGPCPCMLPAPS